MELLIFSILAFTFLMRFGFYPPELKSTVLNTDWLYRRVAVAAGRPVLWAVMAVWTSLSALWAAIVTPSGLRSSGLPMRLLPGRRCPVVPSWCRP